MNHTAIDQNHLSTAQMESRRRELAPQGLAAGPRRFAAGWLLATALLTTLSNAWAGDKTNGRDFQGSQFQSTRDQRSRELGGSFSDEGTHGMPLEITSPVPDDWTNVCDRSAGSHRLGLLVDGRWYQDGAWEPTGYTFSCPRGAIAKCVRALGVQALGGARICRTRPREPALAAPGPRAFARTPRPGARSCP